MIGEAVLTRPVQNLDSGISEAEHFKHWEQELDLDFVRDEAGTYHDLYDTDFSWRHEDGKSFDPLASVNMYRYDLKRFGHVLPETKARVRDEELSLISEAVDRACRTTFVLRRQGNDLTYFNKGEWRSYMGMLATGIEVNSAEADADHRRIFLKNAAVDDYAHANKMRQLQSGERYAWYSAYCDDIEALYGADFVRECGRFPDRRMGFIYDAFCNDEGDIVLVTQTADRSDDEAFEAAMHTMKEGGTLDDGVAAYDAVLRAKYHGKLYAGRRDAELKENAWDTMMQHEDLIDYFSCRLEAIASGNLEGTQLEHTVKRHMYGVWAAFKKRIDSGSGPLLDRDAMQSGGVGVVRYALVDDEVNRAFNQFVAEGRPMVGCGGKIEMLRGLENILNASVADVFKAFFGGAVDRLGSLDFTCSKGHANFRAYLKTIPKCTTCKENVSCGSRVLEKPKFFESYLKKKVPPKTSRQVGKSALALAA